MRSDVLLLPSRRVGGLLQAANPLGAADDPEGLGWRRGLLVQGSSCVRPVRIAPCPEEDANTSPQDPGEYHSFVPAVVRLLMQCAARPRSSLESATDNAAQVNIEWALARELLTGTATENPALVDGVELSDGATVADAIACLEAAAAESIGGRLAFIHVPQGLSIYLPDNVTRDASGVLRTPAGNVVVVSPGYFGGSIYATGEVWAGVDHYQPAKVIDRRAVNVEEASADSLALALFDPCFNVNVATIHEPCVMPDSPGSPEEV